MSLSLHFAALRTRELRELLDDEDKLNHVIRRSEKLQRAQRAAEKMLASNQKLAKVGLSQKPSFRDAKLLLAMKYKELENLRSIIQAKQERLAEEHCVRRVQRRLVRKINQAEEQCELLFHSFADGKTPLADFLDSFLSSRRRQHISLVLVKKLQEAIWPRPLSEAHPDLGPGSPVQLGAVWLPVGALTAAVVLPPCCLPPLLLPVGALLPGQESPWAAGGHGRAPRWPQRPVRLQPLKVQRRRHQPGPQ